MAIHHDSQIIVLVGAEGTGHHAIRQMLRPLARQGRCVDVEERLANRLLRLGATSRLSLVLSRCRGRPARIGCRLQARRDRDALRAIDDLKEVSKTMGVEFFLFAPSIPYDAGGFASRRRSFLKFPNFRALLPALNEVIPVRVIFLERRVEAAAASLLRRGHESNPYTSLLSAELAKALVLYFRDFIRVSAEEISCLEINFDDLVNSPAETSARIGEFLGVEAEDLDKSLLPPAPNEREADITSLLSGTGFPFKDR